MWNSDDFCRLRCLSFILCFGTVVFGEMGLSLANDVLFAWILCMVDATVALRDRSLTVALPSVFRSVYKCRVHLVRIGWLGQ